MPDPSPPPAPGPAHSLSYARVLGSVEPRLWTPPQRELTPATSYGFDVIDFARDVLQAPLDPWQEWAVVHAGELLPDGRPRFRTLLILVARQNGKTHLLVVLTLFWLFAELAHLDDALVLGTSTKLDYAQESWEKAVKLARRVPELDAEIPKKGGIRRTNGEQVLKLESGGRYKIAASNEEGGRSLTIHRLVLDELRQHHSYAAWDASVPATNAVRHGQVIAISNAGGERSIVLNEKRDAALRYIADGAGDPRLGLFEWSAPDGASPTDPEALAMANPQFNRRIDGEALVMAGAGALAAGGEQLAGFRTEIMCQRVKLLDPAIDPEAWAACLDDGTLDDVRGRVALCLDVSLDGQHATLVAAATLDDGRVRVEPVRAWSGTDAPRQLRADLPELVHRIRPRALGWFPAGPAAAVAASLAERSGPPGRWPPAGVQVAELRGETTAVCMGLVDLIRAGDLVHAGDPLLDDQVGWTEKHWQGDAWRFTRKGAGHCDAVYAAAGAAHLARTLPQLGAPRILTSSPG